MKKNVASQTVSAVVVSATDGSAVTASVAITVNGDHGTQGAGGGTLTHEGGGEWSYVPTQAETNFDHILFKFSATGAVPVGVQVYTSSPQTGDAFGLIGAAGAGLTALGDTRIANLDATVSSRSTYAGADTSGTTTLLSRLSSGRATLLDNLDATVSSRSTYAGGAVASVTGNVGGNVTGSIGSLAAQAKADVNAEVDSALDTAIPGSPTANSINERIATMDNAYTAARGALLDNLDAAVSTRSTYAGGAVASVTGAVGSVTGNVGGNVTGSVGSVAAGGITATSFGAGAIDAAALATDAGQEIADRILARSLAGSADGGRDVRSALRFLRNRKAIAAGTLTVYQEDDSTSAWTAAVTTTAGSPISEVDPA